MFYYFFAIMLFIITGCGFITKSMGALKTVSLQIYQDAVFWIVISVLIAMAGLRWYTGNDWPPYYRYFSQNRTWHEFNSERFELFYKILNFTIKYFFNSYSVFLFVFAFLTIYLKAKYIQILSFVPGLSLFLYFCEAFTDIAPVRQSLAISFCLLSVIYIQKKNKRMFLFLTVCAILSHTASIFWLVAYPVYHYKISNFQICLLFLSCLIIGFWGSSTFIYILKLVPLPSYLSLARNYFNNKGVLYGSFVLPLLKRIVIISMLLLCRNYVSLHSKSLSGLINLYIFGQIFYLLFIRGAYGFQRLFTPFSQIEIVMIPNIFYIIKAKKHTRFLLLYLIFLYGIVKLWASIKDTYLYGQSWFVPYMSIFNYNPWIRN